MPEASPLAGIRVIDFADATAALLARRLADFGADVIKVEPPGGDPARRRGPFLGDVPGPERSLWFRYHQQNKSGVILDIETSEGRDMVLKLAAGADVLVETFRPGYLDKLGLGYDALQKINPGLVYAAVTGFGQNGPRRDYRSGDLVAAASGGAMSVCGLPQRPLKPYGEQASQLAALDAAIGVMLALRARAVTGLGQYLDVSLQEAVCAALDHVLPRYLYQSPGVVPGRHGSHHWNGTFAVSPCRDGDLLISPNLEPETLLELMVADGVRGDLDAAALTEISKYTVKHDASELFALGRAMRLPWAVVATPEMVTRSPQLEARGFWVKLSDDELGPIVYPGPPARFSSIKLASRRAPYLGEHNRRLADPAKIWPPRKLIRTGGSISGGILAGVRVLDFTRVLAGPYATRLLGDFGAEVIKVQTRHVMPGVENEQGYFRTWNRNKRSITLNMGRPEGRALAMRLLHKCDVVLENFTPRVLENWGMTYPELKKVKPDIILVSLSGAGHDGPWRDAAAYGATIEALSGVTALTAFGDGPPLGAGFALADHVGGLVGAWAALAALAHRDRCGEGQYVDISEYQAMCGTIGPDLMAVLNGGRSPSAVGNQPEYDLETSGVCCRCAADDGWCVITISGDADWEILRHTLGSPAWMEEARFATPGTRREHAAELQAALETWTRGIAAPGVMRRLQADGLAAAVVEDARDLRHDPHLLARGFFTTARHPLFGETTLDASPIRLSRQPAAWYRLSPALGADNEYVFGEILGLSPADMARCEAEEIIG